MHTVKHSYEIRWIYYNVRWCSRVMALECINTCWWACTNTHTYTHVHTHTHTHTQTRAHTCARTHTHTHTQTDTHTSVHMQSQRTTAGFQESTNSSWSKIHSGSSWYNNVFQTSQTCMPSFPLHFGTHAHTHITNTHTQISIFSPWSL